MVFPGYPQTPDEVVEEVTRLDHVTLLFTDFLSTQAPDGVESSGEFPAEDQTWSDHRSGQVESHELHLLAANVMGPSRSGPLHIGSVAILAVAFPESSKKLVKDVY